MTYAILLISTGRWQQANMQQPIGLVGLVIIHVNGWWLAYRITTRLPLVFLPLLTRRGSSSWRSFSTAVLWSSCSFPTLWRASTEWKEIDCCWRHTSTRHCVIWNSATTPQLMSRLIEPWSSTARTKRLCFVVEWYSVFVVYLNDVFCFQHA